MHSRYAGITRRIRIAFPIERPLLAAPGQNQQRTEQQQVSNHGTSYLMEQSLSQSLLNAPYSSN